MKKILINIGTKSKGALAQPINANKKNKVLSDYFKLIKKNEDLILKENKKDINQAIKIKLKDNLMDRLILNEKKILGIINSIKRNNPKSYIIVVASENNYDYIKSFKNIDEVLLLKKNFINKLTLLKKLLTHKFNSIIVHDGKNRSNFITFFLKSNLKIYHKPSNETSYITGIKKILKTLKFNFLSIRFLAIG